MQSLPEGVASRDVRIHYFMGEPIRFIPWSVMKQVTALRKIRELGLSVTVAEGEYHINYKGGQEATRYHTPDPEDAIATARAMAQSIQKTIEYQLKVEWTNARPTLYDYASEELAYQHYAGFVTQSNVLTVELIRIESCKTLLATYDARKKEV